MDIIFKDDISSMHFYHMLIRYDIIVMVYGFAFLVLLSIDTIDIIEFHLGPFNFGKPSRADMFQ